MDVHTYTIHIWAGRLMNAHRHTKQIHIYLMYVFVREGGGADS